MFTNPSNPCPICGTPAAKVWDSGGGPNVECGRCGKFKVGRLALHEISLWTAAQRANLSGWIREHQGCEIVVSDVPNLTMLRAPPVGEKADRVLFHLSKQCPKAGTRIDVGILLPSMSVFDESNEPTHTLPNDGQLLAIAWSQDADELRFILDDYLVTETGFLKREESGLYKITPKGWGHLASLEARNPQSQQSFIAMWFDEQVNEAWKAIDQGIREAGYTPLRIDQKQHNNEITDEMLAEIRKSRFLVADLTGHRNGVYYEAGFAKGLGIGVVWLCRKDELANAHFDVNHFPVIVWAADKLPELTTALKNRIEATIGRGPTASA